MKWKISTLKVASHYSCLKLVQSTLAAGHSPGYYHCGTLGHQFTTINPNRTVHSRWKQLRDCLYVSVHMPCILPLSLSILKIPLWMCKCQCGPHWNLKVTFTVWLITDEWACVSGWLPRLWSHRGEFHSRVNGSSATKYTSFKAPSVW